MYAMCGEFSCSSSRFNIFLCLAFREHGPYFSSFEAHSLFSSRNIPQSIESNNCVTYTIRLYELNIHCLKLFRPHMGKPCQMKEAFVCVCAYVRVRFIEFASCRPKLYSLFSDVVISMSIFLIQIISIEFLRLKYKIQSNPL